MVMKLTRQEQIAFWRAVGAALEARKGLTEALRHAGGEAGGRDAASVADALARHVEQGATLSAALGGLGEVFDERVAAAVARAEEDGVVERAAAHVAAALDADDLSLLAAQSPQVEAADGQARAYVSGLLRDAAGARASDVHMEPTDDGRGRVRLRIDGVLHDVEPPPPDMYPGVIGALKLMAGMDVAERALSQDGRIQTNIRDNRYDLRVSCVPAYGGEALAIRVLARQEPVLNLTQAISGDDLEKVRALCHAPSGIVIVSGPTGCGKTTLLYSMLMEIDRDRQRVFSIEDPVEYRLPGVTQIQVRPQIGWTFARAQRSILRQDPDVILVGEIRNLEMLNIAVQTAMTGHLLLTTLHARTAAGAVRRLLDIGLEPFLVNSSLLAVISMRLVRRLCPQCRKQGRPEAGLLPAEAAKFALDLREPTFFQPVGCEHCRQTGYRGRMAIYEILRMDDGIRGLVNRSADTAAILAAARRAGMRTMLEDGLEKAARGQTSIEEVLRVAPHAIEG
jgi:general secretion pathway protein E